MTKLYTKQGVRRHRHHQVSFKVDHRGSFKSESMSSLSDVSDVSPPPTGDVDTQFISRIYGAGRKPTTIALSFRPPRKQRFTDKLPRIVNKSRKPKGRRPDNVTSAAGDGASFNGRAGGLSFYSDDSHVTSGRQNNGIVTSKSMHSLSKTNPEVNRRATLPAADGNGVRTITTLLERHQTVTSSPEAKEHRTTDGLLSAEWKPTRTSNTNAARSSSVINN